MAADRSAEPHSSASFIASAAVRALSAAILDGARDTTWMRRPAAES